MIDTYEPLWTVKQVAAYLSVSKDWVYRRVASGVLPHLRFGAHLRFEPPAIRAWLQEQTDLANGTSKIEAEVISILSRERG